jgi:hypothetical protein
MTLPVVKIFRPHDDELSTWWLRLAYCSKIKMDVKVVDADQDSKPTEPIPPSLICLFLSRPDFDLYLKISKLYKDVPICIIGEVYPEGAYDDINKWVSFGKGNVRAIDKFCPMSRTGYNISYPMNMLTR